MEAAKASGRQRGAGARLGELALKALGFFVILEPIWMLLPFAGFLYGSVLQIERLNQSPYTSWLTHFVFPVMTLGPVGPLLVIVGLVLFLIGAGQIYTAKLRRSGLVTGGLYRFVRHPQYVSLTLFGLGVLLAWGRAMMWLAFFLMMFLYYWLARSEERACIRLFGDAYERYRERTSFVIPGDKALRPLGAWLARLRLPAPARVLVGLACTLLICFGLMWLIDAVKRATRTVPYLTATVALGPRDEAAARAELTGGEAAGVPFVQSGRIVVVRGPYRNASASGFAERVALRLRESKTLAGFLAFLDEPGDDVVIVFCGPYDKPPEGEKGMPGMHAGGAPGGRGPAPDPHGPDRVRLILMRCSLAAGASVGDAFADKAKRTIRRGCVAQVNLAKPAGEDIVEGDGHPRGPGFPGEKLWGFFLGQLAAQPARPREGPPVAPGRAESGTLVLVQAPIMKTRLDFAKTVLFQPQSGVPAFATELRDRLAASAQFREQLRKSGVGGDVVAVAFPRPGPNWYREHHHRPQVSIFVILARLSHAGDIKGLFSREGRELLSAFIADVDFSIEAPADFVAGITAIGRRRDLEERWRFFLSGV